MNKILILLSVLAAIQCSLKDQKITHTASLQIEIDGELAGQLTVGLFGDIVPLTVSNFLGICKGDQTSKTTGHLLSYSNTPFHRIIPNFMLQTGDFTHRNGMGGESIYGQKFKDENFTLKHELYCLSMANAGPNTNGSQFFITTANTSWLDGRHVVFGRLVDNQSIQLAKQLEALGSPSGAVQKNINIRKCILADNQDQQSEL